MTYSGGVFELEDLSEKGSHKVSLEVNMKKQSMDISGNTDSKIV